MALQFRGRLATGQAGLDGDVRDLYMADGPGGTFLYAATGRHGGISVYALTSDAKFRLADAVYFGNLSGGVVKTQIGMLTIDGSSALLVGAGSGGGLLYYAIEPDAGLGGAGVLDVPVGEVAAWTESGPNRLYTIDQKTGTLNAYMLDGTGAVRTGSETEPAGLSPTGGLLTSVQSDAGPILVITEGGNGSALASYHAPVPGGTLVATDRAGAAEGLGFFVPTATESIMAHGTSWVIVAAAGSNTLSVLRVGADGHLTPTDHVLDTLGTRFGGVLALSVIEIEGHVFVFAGGSDDGLAVFTLLPNGRLLHLQSLADSQGSGLSDITAIEASRIGDELHVFVASEDVAGLSHFSWAVEALGAVRSDGTALIRGTAGNDILLVPEAGATTITGGGGDDILVSGTGATVLWGGSGADIFVLNPSDAITTIADFQPGTDKLDLSHFPMLRSPSQLTVTALPDGIRLDLRSARIVVSSASGIPLELTDLWHAGRFPWPDRLLTEAIRLPQMIPGSDGDDVLNGGEGADTVAAKAGNDTLTGASGSDSLDGGSGHDVIWGGSGNDTVSGGWGLDTIGTGEGADVISGGGGGDLIWSGPGNDTISGGEGGDELWALDGEDVVWGGLGNDTLGGGAGDDNVTGGAGQDVIFGGYGDDSLAGGDGDDEIWTMTGSDWAWGGNGDDQLGGGAGADTMSGGAGNDTLTGASGSDSLDGGSGHDVIWGGSGNDTVSGGWGLDTIGTGEGADVISGGGGGDLIWSGPGNDTISGGEGGDELWALDGEDVVWGGLGDDTLGGGAGDDNVAGGAGQDVIFGGYGDDSLAGGEGDDEIWTMTGSDWAWGGDGDDQLGGGAGADTMSGGAGNDTLTGGAGDDRLLGLEGADVFVFGTGHGQDRIMGFEPGQDRIEFTGGTQREALTIEQIAGGTEIVSPSGTIILEGVAPGQLEAGDFLFT